MKFKSIALFIAIFALAATFRFVGVNWDRDTHLHPDERFLTMVATNMSWPQNIIQYFDTAHSPLNPNNVGFTFYVYGTWPVILTKAIATSLHKASYDDLPLVGRSLAALADLVTLVFVFLITKKLQKRTHDDVVPYIAMFLYAVMVLPIQLSHFFAVDPFMVMCLTISLYCIVAKRLGAILGLFVGLAVGAKISSVLILPVVAIAYLSQWPHNKKKLILQGLLFIVMFLITLRISYPYLFVDTALNPQTMNAFTQLKAFDGDDTTFPPGLQWVGTPPLLFPLKNIIAWGLGIPLSILVTFSLLYFLFDVSRALRKKLHDQQEFLVPLMVLFVFMATIFLYQGVQFAKALRYFYPIYPILAVFTALYVTRAYMHFHHLSKLFRYGVVSFLGLLLILYPLAFISIYQKPNTRIAASQWIYEHIPNGKTLSWEHWDDPLPLGIDGHAIGEYKTHQLPMFDPDTDEKWQTITTRLADTDYVILSSNRVYGSVTHVPDRYPTTNHYYSLLFGEKLGFVKVAEFTSRPTLFGVQINDDHAEESFTVYDHAKVTIFQNKDRLPASTLMNIISTQ